MADKNWRVCWSLELEVEAPDEETAVQRLRDLYRDDALYVAVNLIFDEDPVQVVEIGEDGDPIL